MRVWNPTESRYEDWDGREVTPHRDGVSFGPGPGHKVTPRLVGPAVSEFRRTMGCCQGLEDTCANIAGHAGECKP